MSTNKERLIAALQEPLETTLTRYKTHLDGLKEDQVEENRDLYGENVITKGQEDSIIKKIYESIINPFTVILLVIALVSFITNVWLAKPGEEDPTTSIIIVTLVLISGGIRFIQELRSDKAASNLSRMIVNTATVLRDGSEQEIPIDEIVVGDVVKLSAGDMIPADVVLLDSRDFFVQQSGLTGESDAVEKACLAKADGQNLESLLESESLAFMGTNVISGRATALVLVVGDETMMGAIEQTINTYDEPTSFEREMNSISWLLIRLMLVMVPVVFVINGLTDGDWLEAGVFALSVGVGLTPEMLPMIVTSTLARGAVKLSKQKVIVKHLDAIQNFGAMDILCTDKTGTLTKGVFAVSQVSPANGCTDKELLEQAALAESFSSHPISKSLREACSELDARRATDAQEIAGHGVRTMVDGHVVLAGNARMMDDSKITYTKNTGTGTVVYVARDGQFLGSVLIADEVKEHSKQAIAALKAQGVRTIMLTGDSEAVASEISGQLGLDEYHAQLLPADKVNRVEELLATKGKNDILTFAGDGINDAPVLMRADVGIAMGAMGSDAAIEAADVVLMDDDPAKISLAMKISRKCMHIVYQNIVFALAVKAIFLLLGAFGIANMWWAVFADVGVMILAVLNAMRMLIVEKN